MESNPAALRRHNWLMDDPKGYRKQAENAYPGFVDAFVQNKVLTQTIDEALPLSTALQESLRISDIIPSFPLLRWMSSPANAPHIPLHHKTALPHPLTWLGLSALINPYYPTNAEQWRFFNETCHMAAKITRIEGIDRYDPADLYHRYHEKFYDLHTQRLRENDAHINKRCMRMENLRHAWNTTILQASIATLHRTARHIGLHLSPKETLRLGYLAAQSIVKDWKQEDWGNAYFNLSYGHSGLHAASWVRADELPHNGQGHQLHDAVGTRFMPYDTPRPNEGPRGLIITPVTSLEMARNVSRHMKNCLTYRPFHYLFNPATPNWSVLVGLEVDNTPELRKSTPATLSKLIRTRLASFSPIPLQEDMSIACMRIPPADDKKPIEVVEMESSGHLPPNALHRNAYINFALKSQTSLVYRLNPYLAKKNSEKLASLPRLPDPMAHMLGFDPADDRQYGIFMQTAARYLPQSHKSSILPEGDESFGLKAAAMRVLLQHLEPAR